MKALLPFANGAKLHRSRKGGIADINSSIFQLI